MYGFCSLLKIGFATSITCAWKFSLSISSTFVNLVPTFSSKLNIQMLQLIKDKNSKLLTNHYYWWSHGSNLPINLVVINIKLLVFSIPNLIRFKSLININFCSIFWNKFQYSYNFLILNKQERVWTNLIKFVKIEGVKFVIIFNLTWNILKI